MYHYLITFNVVIDTRKPIFGRLGTSTPQDDLLMAKMQVRQEVERRCRDAYPKARHIIVTIMNVERTSEAEQIESGKSFQP